MKQEYTIERSQVKTIVGCSGNHLMEIKFSIETNNSSKNYMDIGSYVPYSLLLKYGI